MRSKSSVLSATNKVFMTNGRSAIYAALTLSKVRAGDVVLMPTYHCASMIAPADYLGATIKYYGVDAVGSASLENCQTHLDEAKAAGIKVRAILLPHFFGWPQPKLIEFVRWCRLNEVVLIEDCAHQPIGNLGPGHYMVNPKALDTDGKFIAAPSVGELGDYVISSLGKFFPTLHGGLLSSAKHSLEELSLLPMPGPLSKSWQHEIFVNQAASGYPGLFAKLYRAQLKLRGKPIAKRYPKSDPAPTLAQLKAQFDVTLAGYQAPKWLEQIVNDAEVGQIAAVRQMRVRQWLLKVADLPGCRPIFNEVPEHTAPYVFPIWLDNPQPIFESLRVAGVPVFRWDWTWPDTPRNKRDHGFLWAHHVVQLPCHQSISDEQFEYITTVFKNAVAISLDTLIVNDSNKRTR